MERGSRHGEGDEKELVIWERKESCNDWSISEFLVVDGGRKFVE